MRVVIAGGHGKVALLLERLLAGRGDQAVGLIRNPAQAADVQNAGADGVVGQPMTAAGALPDTDAASGAHHKPIPVPGPAQHRPVTGPASRVVRPAGRSTP